MTTNLLATITVMLVTNVISGSNESGCRICGGLDKHFGFVPHLPCTATEAYKPPTEKWIITNVARITTLQFDWRGTQAVIQAEIVLRTTNRWTLNQEWRQVP